MFRQKEAAVGSGGVEFAVACVGAGRFGGPSRSLVESRGERLPSHRCLYDAPFAPKLRLLAFDAVEAGRLTPPGESFFARRLELPSGALADLRNFHCRPGIRPNKKRAGPPLEEPAHRSGNDLLSHRVSPAVPSALEGLTSEFGMGSGVTPPQ